MNGFMKLQTDSNKCILIIRSYQNAADLTVVILNHI